MERSVTVDVRHVDHPVEELLGHVLDGVQVVLNHQRLRLLSARSLEPLLLHYVHSVRHLKQISQSRYIIVQK